MIERNNIESEQFHECVPHNSQVWSWIWLFKVSKNILNRKKYKWTFWKIFRLFQFLGEHPFLFFHFEKNSKIRHHLNPYILQYFKCRFGQIQKFIDGAKFVLEKKDVKKRFGSYRLGLLNENIIFYAINLFLQNLFGDKGKGFVEFDFLWEGGIFTDSLLKDDIFGKERF